MAVKLSSEYVMGGFTPVDNIFICEYMKNAPDAFVKIYIYGLYLAQSSRNTDVSDFCLSLGVTAEETAAAYNYFAEYGLVDVLCDNPLDVVYLPISNSPARPRKIKPGKYDDFNKHLQSIVSARMLTPNEYMEFYNLLELYHIQPEAFLVIAQYCVSIQGAAISSRYILAVAKNLAYRKITTLKAVEDEFKNYDKNAKQIISILSSLSLKRKIEMEDNELYRKWLSQGFDDDAVLAAAKTVKSGGMKKLDAVLSELYSYKKFTATEIQSFAKTKKDTVELTYSINRNLGVFYQSVDVEIEKYVSKWLEMGFSGATLVEIAKICYVRSIKTLEGMDDYVERFRKLGLLTEKAIFEYIEAANKKDDIIKRVLDLLGFSRKVNPYDRENYARFESLGMTEELIEYAASLARGKASPYPYMYAILNDLAKKNITSLAEAQKQSPAENTKKSAKPQEIITRDFSKEQIDAMFDSIDAFTLK